MPIYHIIYKYIYLIIKIPLEESSVFDALLIGKTPV
jgi:hypothetical protein